MLPQVYGGNHITRDGDDGKVDNAELWLSTDGQEAIYSDGATVFIEASGVVQYRISSGLVKVTPNLAPQTDGSTGLGVAANKFKHVMLKPRVITTGVTSGEEGEMGYDSNDNKVKVNTDGGTTWVNTS